MAEELKTAQTTEQSEVGSHADADNGAENVNDVAFEDADTPAAEGENETEKQSKEQNSANARRRREAERQAALKEAREQAIIDTLGGKNPYTGEAMKDSADVEEYLAMRDIEKTGGDPIMDFSRHHKEKAREQVAKEKESEGEKEWYRSDAEAFQAKYPDVDLNKLIQDEGFQLFADGKVEKKIPLAEIYEGYVKIVGEFEKQAQKKATQILANKKASPGSLSSTNVGGEGFFTREQVAKMSSEEISKNYDKIREDMKRW